MKIQHVCSLQARLEEIKISDIFVTRLHICAVVQTPHIYKKTNQTPLNSVPSKGGNISVAIKVDR